MEKISVIVPIYNVELYLEKCLESIINQTYKNLEIILVNDGSKDNSLEICNKYKLLDDRIKLINKENGGLSDARNIGIDNATGKYIVFIDSDDWIDITMIEKLYNLLKEHNVSVAQCDYEYVIDEENNIIKKDVYNKIRVMSNLEALESIYSDDGVKSIVVWNKIYKKELFDNIRFPSGKIHEDEFTTYKIFDLSKKIVITNEILYFYRQREGSIMNSQFNVKRLDIIQALKSRIEYLKNKGYDKLILLTENKLEFLLKYNIIEIYESNIDNKDIYVKNLHKDVKKYYFDFMQNRYINFKSKIMITLLLISPKLYYANFKIRTKRKVRPNKNEANH